jgi:hypothetical protein
MKDCIIAAYKNNLNLSSKKIWWTRKFR